MTVAPAAPFPWSWARALAVRVVAVYVLLYTTAFFGLARFWWPLADWLIERLGLEMPERFMPNGSGDTLQSYVQVALWLGLALLLGSVWALLEARVTRLRELTLRLFWPAHTLLRYWVASSLLTYGWIKVFQAQMPQPDLVGLAMPMSEMSPMGVLWRMVGFSPLYQVAGGLAEVLPGVLLLFHRTSLAGALLGAGVMAYVFLLNLSYDVPVKLFSGHLMAFCLLLALPFWRRLWALLTGGAAEAVVFPPKPGQPWLLWSGRVLRGAALVYLLLLLPWQHFQLSREYVVSPVRHHLSGIYRVQDDSLPAAPRLADDERWSRLVLGDLTYQSPDKPVATRAALDAVNGDSRKGVYLLNESDGRLTLTLEGLPYSFCYALAGEKLTLRGLGKEEGRTLTLRRDPDAERLVRRGFRWVSDRPFNR